MGVPVVIDGYNLLYARGEAPSAESREALIRDLVRWARLRQRSVVLVFDAWAQGTREAREATRGPVTVHFTRQGERADAYIVRWVGQHREAVVVTSDRAVQQGARRRGAAILGAADFADRLLAALAPEDGVAADEPSAEEPRVTGAPGSRGRQAAWLRGL